jgi:hypothetical protein
MLWGTTDAHDCFQVGLLPRDNEAQVPFAYRMYKRTDAEGIKLCAGFKQTYCQTVTIEFMGVWYARSSSQSARSQHVLNILQGHGRQRGRRGWTHAPLHELE